MQVRIKPPSEMEAAGIKLTDDGIELSPLFYDMNASATIGVIEVVNAKGKVVFQGELTVSGQSGKPGVKQRMKAVVPKVDR